MKQGFSIITGGAIALSAATAKTILGAKSGSAFSLDLQHVDVGFDGVTPSAVPVLVELCACTFGANAPGTNSTSVTPAQKYGRQTTPGFTAGKNWTTEPTTITVIEEQLLTPAGGIVKWQYPFGSSPDSALAEGFAIRCTAPASVNVRAWMDLERC